jgi:sigma-B regulation protein RsbU (phosphoserine phosphatase)
MVRATPLHGDSVVELSRLRTTIGRSARNDLCVEDPFASRLHAEVRRRGDTYWISDLGSANGTLVNGSRLTVPVLLRDRDLIRIGETEIEYSDRIDTAPARRKTNLLFAEQGAGEVGEGSFIPVGLNSAAKLISTLEKDPPVPAARSTAMTPGEPRPGKAAELEPGRPDQDERAAPPVPLIKDDTLSMITRVSLTLLSPLSLDETLRQVLECVFEVVEAERGYVMLLETDSEKKESRPELVCKASRYRSGEGRDETEEVEISQSISEQVLREGRSVLTSDARHDPRFQERQSIVLGGVRSVMAVPLAVEKRVSGMIYVDNLLNINRFTERDLQLLTLIAGVAAIRIENMSLLELQEEQRRLANELEVASEIQLSLHPAVPPTIPGYDLDGCSFPCYEVGGDYYDFIGKSDGRHVVALGDVSGKGTGAALLMSSVHAAVRAHTRTRLSAAEVVAEINHYICDNSPANRYVTLFYSELDPRTNELTYINAGHNAPVLVRASGEVTRLDIGGFPVGITPAAVYGEGWVGLEPGDALVIFSDGATESQNEEGDEFGEPRMIEVVRKNRHRSAAGIRDRIDEALAKFVGKAKAIDDLTLVIVKRQE